MPISKEVMEVLACPKCKGDVSAKGSFLICEKCGLAYPVLGDIVPDMLLEDAWDLERANKAAFKHNLKL